MTNNLILNAPPLWKQYAETVELWHGCVESDALAIRANGVDPQRGHPATDFGRGFYTTTIRRQARHWAWQRASVSSQTVRKNRRPVVLRFQIPLARLAELNSLQFVVGDFANERFWSLVHYCRGSTPGNVRDHLHPDSARGGWYDMVVGPVAAFWQQRVAMTGADQFSFHTTVGAAVLNEVIRLGHFQVFRVRAR